MYRIQERGDSLAVRLPQRVQEPDELLQVLLGQAVEGVYRAAKRSLESVQETEPFLGDRAQDLPPVRRAPLASDEAFPLEPVEQARDAGRLLDHPRRDLESREAVGPGAPENPQDVVLLERDAVGREHGFAVAGDE